MRAIWTGAIGFGLVNIPVKLYSATQESTLDLDMLDKKDHSKIKFQRINESSGKVVAWKDIVKAYKLSGDYVVLDEKDFAQANPEKSKIINIDSFVDEKDVDTIYFETPYYLEPDKSGQKAYKLLYDALEKSGKAGLGSFVLRSKEHLCLIKPYENILILNRLRFAEEIRETSELKTPAKAKPAASELKMALTLIDQLTAPFKIDKFKDNYTSELLKLIKAKAKGKKVVHAPLKVTHRKTNDLMALLKSSIKKAS
ncbi:MAG TPA: Ku protein [Chryseolinea sp.]|nr:Ku protein [Chryseolinea sp.]